MAPTETLATWREGRVFPFTRELRRVLEEQKATFTMRPKSADLRSPIGSDRARFGLPADAPVTSGYEAGREGCWLHRYSEAHGIRSLAGRRGSLRLRQLDSCVLGTASPEVAR